MAIRHFELSEMVEFVGLGPYSYQTQEKMAIGITCIAGP